MKRFIAAAGIACMLLIPQTYGQNADLKVQTEIQETVRTINSYKELEYIIANNKKVTLKIDDEMQDGWCKFYQPKFEKVAEKYKDEIMFCEVFLDKIDKKDAGEIDSKYKGYGKLGYAGLPRTLFFYNGVNIFAETGVLAEDQLSELIDLYLSDNFRW